MIPRSLLFPALALGALALCCTPLRAEPTAVTAMLDSDQIAAGEAAQLTVAISGATSAQPEIPKVDGLEITSVGQSSNFQIVNTTVTRSISYTYQVVPTRAGVFTIPAIAVGKLRSAPLTLTVAAGAGAGTPPPAASGGSAGSAASVAPPDDGSIAFLRLTLPKKEFYVGEMVPLEVRAYFRAGVQASLETAPTLQSDAFTLLPIRGKARQTAETIGGETYNVLSWPTALTAIKAGDASLGLEMPVTLLVRQKAQRPPGFNDPMFDDFFGTVVQKKVTLRNEAPPAKVLPLPAENRPADFSGAVGDFALDADVSPRQAAEGDPLTLKVRVTGRGSFDRVTSPLLATSPEWKTYPPSAKFDDQDGLGTLGTKTFEQAIIPSGSGAKQVPPVIFSYFDPEARRYVSRSTAPLDIAIAPAPAGSASAPIPAVAAAPSPSAPPASDLAPNKVDAGRFVPSLRPLFLSPAFLALQGVPLAALALGLVLLRRRRVRAGDLRRRRREEAARTISLHLREADAAAVRGDDAAFFSAARAALRERLGERWSLPPETITLAEVEARTPSDSAARALFRRADEAAFSGNLLSTEDLAPWRQSLLGELRKDKE